MKQLQIAKEATNAVNSCLLCYTNKKLSQEAYDKILQIIKDEQPQQSEDHKQFSKEYKKYVASES